MTGTTPSPEGQERNTGIWIGKTQVDPYWDYCACHFDVVSYDNIYDAVADILIHGPVRVCVVNVLTAGTELQTLIQTILSKELSQSVCLYNAANVPLRHNISFAGDLRIRTIQSAAELADQLESILLKKYPEGATAQTAKVETASDQTIPEQTPEQTSQATKTRGIDILLNEDLSTALPWPIEPPRAERADETEPGSLEVGDIPCDEIDDIIQEKIKAEMISTSSAEKKDILPEESPDILNLDKIDTMKRRKILPEISDEAQEGEGQFHLAELTSEELDALLSFEPERKSKDRP